jgi:hypothetical protein
LANSGDRVPVEPSTLHGEVEDAVHDRAMVIHARRGQLSFRSQIVQEGIDDIGCGVPRPLVGEVLEKFAQLYDTTAIELIGTRVATDDPVTTSLLNLAPALLKEFDMQSRIHGVLGALMETAHLERLLERPARAGVPTYSLPSPRTLTEPDP